MNVARGAPGEARSTVLAAIRRQATEHPDALAVVADDQQLAYRQLVTRSGRLADVLRARTAGTAEPVIGVCLGRGVDAVAAMLAVMAAGGVYFPIDETLPAGRIRRMIDTARPALVLAAPELAGLLDHPSVPPVPAAVDPGGASALGDGDWPAPALDAAAYLVFTSGTTGLPKGIELPWRTLDHLAAWSLRHNERPRRIAQLASLGFDVSIQEMIAGLTAGATVVVADRWTRRDPQLLAEFIGRTQVDTAHLPPAALRGLADQWVRTGADLTLRRAYVAGEALRITPALRTLLSDGRLTVVQNEYGTSEAQVVTIHPVREGALRYDSLPPIGRTVEGSAVYVLNGDLRPVAAGRPGEIFIGGDSLARGYRGQPALTAERFLPDPFAEVPGRRMYRSGDIGRIREDGLVEYLSRADDQISIRGHRVEPREVDAVLAEHPDVAESATAPVGGPDGPVLRAHVRPVAGAAPQPAALVAYLRGQLAEHLVPQVVLVSQLRYNANGKLDPGAMLDAVPGARRPDPPATATERTVAACYARVLGQDAVGADDDLRDLGGHSLSAARLAVELERDVGVLLSVRDLLRLGTPRAVAGRVDEQRRTAEVRVDG
jgi:nonribosomal peptide synthetase DhbF